MNFYKADVNGHPLWYKELPSTWESISDFDKLSSDQHKTYGFLPVTKVKPPYDQRYQTQSGPSIVVGASTVTATWANHDRSLTLVKSEQLKKVRGEASTIITKPYPLWKQLNKTIPGTLTTSEIEEMDTFISTVRSLCNAAEAAIASAENGPDAVAAGIVDWPTLGA